MNEVEKNKQAQWRTINFLSDKPLDVFDREHQKFDHNDAARGEAIAEQLARQLSDFIYNRRATENSPPRIGILGGLGQGKTSVIKWTLEKIKKNHPQFQESKSVEWFNAAFYKSDELEHEFDRLVGSIAPQSWTEKICSLLAYIPLGIIPLTLLGVMWNLLEVSDGKILIACITLLGGGSLIAYLFKPWIYLLRSGQ